MELTGSRDKITLRMGAIGDIIKEANYWAEKEKKKKICAHHVEKAIDKKKYRSNLIEERIQEILSEIYDTEKPFTQVSDPDVCVNCPYINLCGR